MPRCYLCNNDGIIRRIYPVDRYQQLIGIADDTRVWYVCQSCRLMWQTNCLNERHLRDIYSHYRDTSFRNETVKEIFLRIDNLPPEESETEYRYQWFKRHIGIEGGDVLDIGSGFGIWPNMLKRHGWYVQCTEPNEESCRFINDYLKIACSNSFNLDSLSREYDVVSIVHVLEHIRKPLGFLEAVKGLLKPNGQVFIEVPDATEFDNLSVDHDEFNSTHLFFYDTASLFSLLSKMFFVTDIHRVHYEKRGLYRILALCQNRS